MILYFLDSRNNKRLVKKGIKSEEAFSTISQYVNNINPAYKIHYIRTWYSEEDKGTIYDVGSHSEFFLLTDEK